MRPSRPRRLAVLLNRLFLGGLFFTAGMAKQVKGFPMLMGPAWLEQALAPYHLGLFARFVAVCQVLIGALLLTQRFATLGAIMLLPMLLNILVITVSLEWRGTPYVISFLLALNFALLLHDYHRLKLIVLDDAPAIPSDRPLRREPRRDALWLLGLCVLLVGLLFSRDHARVTLALTGVALGLFLAVEVWPRAPRPAAPDASAAAGEGACPGGGAARECRPDDAGARLP